MASLSQYLKEVVGNQPFLGSIALMEKIEI